MPSVMTHEYKYTIDSGKFNRPIIYTANTSMATFSHKFWLHTKINR